jgi:hypothetical protein
VDSRDKPGHDGVTKGSAKPAPNAATSPRCATARVSSATPAAGPRGARELEYCNDVGERP